MPYDVFLPEFFKGILKDLKKKYRSVSEDLKIALRLVVNNPDLGKTIQSFEDVKKLRVRNSDAQKGKRGGYRLIYFVDRSERKIVPLLLYSKSHKTTVTKKELKMLLSRLDQELSG